MFTMSSFPVCSSDKYSSTVKSRLFPGKCKILIKSGTRKELAVCDTGIVLNVVINYNLMSVIIEKTSYFIHVYKATMIQRK